MSDDEMRQLTVAMQSALHDELALDVSPLEAGLVLRRLIEIVAGPGSIHPGPAETLAYLADCGWPERTKEERKDG